MENNWNISHVLNFEMSHSNNQINQDENNIQNDDSTLKKENKKSKAFLTKSVISLVDCFICMQPADNPIACPKCHHFACNKCLLHYFDNNKDLEKKCPYCREKIKYNDLKNISIIVGLKKVMQEKKNIDNKKIEEMINNKKKTIEKALEEITENNEKLKNLIEKFQEDKMEYMSFFKSCIEMAEKRLENYLSSILKLLNYSINQQTEIKKILKEYEKISINSKNNFYNNNEKIRELTNNLLSLEKKEIFPFGNEKENQIQKIEPFFKFYDLKNCIIKDSDFRSKNIFNLDRYQFGLGKIKLSFDNEDVINIKCKVEFNITDENKNSSFLVLIKKANEEIFGGNYVLKKFKIDKEKCSFVVNIPVFEFFDGDEKAEISVKILEFRI